MNNHPAGCQEGGVRKGLVHNFILKRGINRKPVPVTGQEEQEGGCDIRLWRVPVSGYSLSLITFKATLAATGYTFDDLIDFYNLSFRPGKSTFNNYADETKRFSLSLLGNDSNLLIVFYVQIMPDDLVMQLHRF